MKNICHPANHFYGFMNCILVFLLLALNYSAYSQEGNETPKRDSTAAEEQPTIEKKELRMSFEAFKINQELKLVARVRSKVDKKFQNTAGVEVSFYKNEISPENLLGKNISNHKGEAYWLISLEGIPDSLASPMTFLSSVKDNPDFEDVEETATFNPSTMTIQLEEEDTTRLVKVFIGHPDETGSIVPLADAECIIYVKREFGNLPISETETTDAEGNINVEFPDSIQGDPDGNVTIIAKVAGNDMIGNVEVSQTKNWGIPVKADDFYKKRELWSARANSPIPLVLVVNGALILIWGAIAFIFWEIIRINKIGKVHLK